jgi:hypothetical protein
MVLCSKTAGKLSTGIGWCCSTPWPHWITQYVEEVKRERLEPPLPTAEADRLLVKAFGPSCSIQLLPG